MDNLLMLLQRDARTSHADLAAQLDTTVEDIAQRIAAYERDGTILSYRAVIDPEKIATGIVQAVSEVRLTPERAGGFDRVAERIAKFDQVQACYLMSGGYDLLVFVEAKTLREVAAFVTEKLSPLGGITATATRFRLKTYKENGAMLTESGHGAAKLSVAP
jgi:DNA-binding Lrp family transcriptional regulator